MAAELIRQSVEIGIECHLGAFDNAGRGDRQAIDACRGTAAGWIVPCRRQFDRAAVVAIADYVERYAIDVVHSHKYKTTFHALLARRRRPFKLVATYHNWLIENRSLALYAAIDKRIARFCDAAVAVSESVFDELARFVPRSKLRRIGNGVDTSRFSPRDTKAATRSALGLRHRHVAGFVGRLDRRKGVDDLIEAVAALQSRDIDLLIVGDGDHRATLEQTALRSGIADRVHFLGTRSDTPELYGALDLFVLPSLVEAFPMVVLESMACGVPVIGTDVGDVAKIVERERTGWVVPPADRVALGAAISGALRDEERLEAMGRNARRTVTERYSAQHMAQQYAECYREI